MAQLNKRDRQEISYFLLKGYGPTAIGQMIGRDKSVISREIKRNSVKKEYVVEKAQVKSYQRRYWLRTAPQKISNNKYLRTYIESKLMQLNPWSPETIAAYWNLTKASTYECKISAPTIYKYLYDYRPSLCKYLCFKRQKKRKSRKKTKRTMIPNKVSIELRPAVVAEKNRIGDWEGDTIASIKQDKTAFLVLLDRKSRLIRVSKTKDLKKRRIILKVRKLLKDGPKHTLTLDNGLEFKGHKSFGLDTFFCNPYSSWEKGAVEYSNRLIRRHFPKKTVLASVSPKKLSNIVHAINNTPRKCLNWKTPFQVFFSIS